ncbi:MAG: hypothetical protein ACFFD8_05990 [Candidatus Thorarchaeota archaeon]
MIREIERPQLRQRACFSLDSSQLYSLPFIRLTCPQAGHVMALVVERCTEETVPDSITVVFITSLFSLMLFAPKKIFKPLDLGIGRQYQLNPAK